MLAARNRLIVAEDFREVLRRGRRAAGPLLVVHLLTRTSATEGDPSRVGLVVSRAVGPAVTRNLVKRRLRHLARERLAALPGSSMLVLRALPAAAGASYAELGAELDRCLAKATKQATASRPVRTSVTSAAR